ncbi:MAG: hypothetical protein KDC92_13200, partial [Bacteroidetes bacterium]|nr:hypothetical protein [Bacteroidota bacterium]
MDTNSILDNEIGNLQISDYAKNELDNTRKWTLFLSILGILMAAFIVVLSIFFMTQIGGMFIVIAFVYMLMSLLVFFPYFFLFRFSNSIKNAITHS